MPQNPILSLQLPTAHWPCQAPSGRHILGAWIRWAPSRFSDGSSWDEKRFEMTDRIVEILGMYSPGFRNTVEWSRLYTPTDIERATGITDASIRHLDMTLDQVLDRRPLPRWCRYESPVQGLWLCGSRTHPCGSVAGAPGHNCAKAILRKRGAIRIANEIASALLSISRKPQLLRPTLETLASTGRTSKQRRRECQLLQVALANQTPGVPLCKALWKLVSKDSTAILRKLRIAD